MKVSSETLPHNPPRSSPPFSSIDRQAKSTWVQLWRDFHTLTHEEALITKLERELHALESGPLGAFWIGHIGRELKLCRQVVRAYQAAEATLTEIEAQLTTLTHLAQHERTYELKLQQQIEKIELTRLSSMISALNNQDLATELHLDHTRAKIDKAGRLFDRAKQLLAESYKSEDTIAASHQLYVQAIQELNAAEEILASSRDARAESQELQDDLRHERRRSAKPERRWSSDLRSAIRLVTQMNNDPNPARKSHQGEPGRLATANATPG